MKTSYSHLPDYAKNDLQQIVSLILERVPHCEMIILYGSYARGTFVEYDERDEFGILTSFMSDYDLLVIMLYDSGNYKLEPARKLNFEEVRQQAQEYFEESFNSGNEFFENAKFNYSKGWYKKASFMLHQTCENYFYALRLVHTLKNSKQHNLSKLLGATHKYSPELRKIFPRKMKEDKRLFELLRLAYVEARYNSKFVVTQEEIEALFPKVEKLRDITEQICKSQIEVYRQMGK
ncbi:HEPN domain-containing protein [Parabacteroides goldsteinii]|uniref:HEPN domain-containing protein n=1 Tax=Parabacteroides goldsteinii TaxID=328812 RepID=UPI00242B1C7B|nr:HEPN domain-containing protein [Parabacteroides goldsteinii]